ncbi:hypothetical protein ABKV19_020620, partial [Rosa sericea]
SQLPQGKVRWVSFLLKRSLTVTRIGLENKGLCPLNTEKLAHLQFRRFLHC